MKGAVLTASVLIVAIILLRRVFGARISARLQYALWLLVAVRLLLPVTMTQSALSVLNIGAQNSAPATYASIDRSYAAAEDDIVPESTPAAQPAAQSTQPQSVRTAQINPLIAVWVTGMVAVGGWYAYTNLALYRSLRRTRLYVGLAGRRPVYLCAGLSSPCVFGSFHPAIYLNDQSLCDPQTARFALAHERRHIAHGDPFWSLVRALCVTVYWFNPLVWVAAHLSRLDSELACDESVVRRLGDDSRFVYGHALLAMAAGRPAALAPCFSTKNSLPRRIERLSTHTRTAMPAVISVLVCALLLISCTFTAARTPDYMTAPCAYSDAAAVDIGTGEDGVVLTAWAGADVVAVFDGTVSYQGPETGKHDTTGPSDCLVLSGRDGTNAFYLPVTDLAVAEGDRVKAGDRLGTVGEDGKLTFSLNYTSKDDPIEPLDPFDYLQPFSVYTFGMNVDDRITPLNNAVYLPEDTEAETLQNAAKALERQLKAESIGAPGSAVWHTPINLTVFGNPASVRIYADASLQEDLLAQDSSSQYYVGLNETQPIAFSLDPGTIEEGFTFPDYFLFPASDADEQSFFIHIMWESGDSLLAAVKVKQA